MTTGTAVLAGETITAAKMNLKLENIALADIADGLITNAKLTDYTINPSTKLDPTVPIPIASLPDRMQVTTTTLATYTLSTSNDLLICNRATAVTVNLPAATGSKKVYNIKNINTGTVTVTPNGVETVDGETTQSLYQYESMTVVDNASGTWVIL